MKEKESERERQEVLWSDTHAKIAIVDTHTKKVALSESTKVDQNFFTHIPPFSISQLSHGGRICQILGGKYMFKPRSSKDGTFNLGSPLETKGFTPKSMFKFATNISRIIRIVRNTSVAVKSHVE